MPLIAGKEKLFSIVHSWQTTAFYARLLNFEKLKNIFFFHLFKENKPPAWKMIFKLTSV